MSNRPDVLDAEIGVSDAVREQRPLVATEIEEFAKVLRIKAGELRPYRGEADGVSPEVTDEQATYEQLVSDPIKTMVSQSAGYFSRVKVDLIRRLAPIHLGRQGNRGIRILDVGCGPGEMMHLLSSGFDGVYGCDVSPSMVIRAGENARVMPSPTEIPYGAGMFDLAVCACVYHHVDDAERVAHMAEVGRVLRPGGLLMMFEHNPRNPVTRHIVNRCPLDASADLLGASKARRYLQLAGFENVQTRYYLHFPEALYRWLGWLEPVCSVFGMGGQYCNLARWMGRS